MVIITRNFIVWRIRKITTWKIERMRIILKRTIIAIGDTPSQTRRAPIIKIPVVLEGKEVNMELDSGAAVSVVSHADYCKYFKHLPLTVAKKSYMLIRTPLKVMG